MQVRSCSSDAVVTTEVVRDQDALDALAASWGELYASSDTATPFQTHAWTASWARAYCPPGRLRVVLVRSDGELAAVAPLYVRTTATGVRVLSPLGGELSDFSDLLLPPDRPQVAEALVRALLDEPGWSALDLPQLRPDAVATGWAQTWPGEVVRLTASASAELPAQPLDEVLGRLPSRSAKVVRRKLRKADELDLTVQQVPADAARPAVSAMLDLHHQQWRGRGMNPEHGHPRFRGHLAEALAAMVAQGQARIAEYRIDGDLVASQIYLVGHRFVGAYLVGISPRFRELADVSALMLREDLRWTMASGRARYSMMRGLEEYKLRWRPEVVQNHRLLLLRPGSPTAQLPAAAAVARQAAVRLVRTHAPRLQQFRDRLRTLTGP